FEFDGTNHSMSATADTWSHTWTPDDHGNFTYTIYMKSTTTTTTTTTATTTSTTTTTTTTTVAQPMDPTVTNTLSLVVGTWAVIIVVVLLISEILIRKGKW
ncbi:MAG: hypothetical protein KAR03_10895, partial [Candidatus Thorarchaeota archaeon]|nr:hypothetical protein [Candidatus Thorarchaeota archaeon]